MYDVMIEKIRFAPLFVLLLFMQFFSLSFTVAEGVENGSIYGIVFIDNMEIEGTKVILQKLGSELNLTVSELSTDLDGRFVFHNVTLNSEYILTSTVNGYTHSRFFEMNDTEEQFIFNFSGRLEVRVTSPDGSGVEGQLLKLYNLMGVNELNSTTDVNGIGVFEHLDINDTYYVLMNYRKIPYSFMTKLKEKNHELEIQTIKSTMNDDDFQVEFQHLIIQSDGDEIKVWEVINMQNIGDKIFNTSWLKGWIPANSYDLTHDSMDCCFQIFDTGDFIFDPMSPLFPSDKTRLSLNYKIEALKPKQIIEKRIIYDTNRIIILVEKLPKIEIEPLIGVVKLGSEVFGNSEYIELEGTKLKAGDLIQIRFITKISILEFLPNIDQTWNIVKLIIPFGLFAFVFVTYIRKDELEKLEKEKWMLYVKLADAEINLVEGEITSNEFREIEHAIKKDLDEIISEIQEIEEELDKVNESYKFEYERELLDEVKHIINIDFKDGFLSKESYNKILSKYEEKKKRLLACTET
jgi:hypothetical protein